MKTHKNLIEEFLIFEEENNLFDWEINSVPIWELIRTSVFTRLSKELVNDSIINRKQKKSSRLLIIFDLFLNFFKDSFFNLKKNTDILIFNHPRRKLSSNFYFDIYTDYFLPKLNHSHAVLESFESLNTTHKKPIKTKNLYYLDSIQLGSRFLSRFLFRKLSSSEKDKINNIQFKIFEFWGVRIFDFQQEIQFICNRWRIAIFFAKRVINICKPKLIINVVSYSFINQVFTFICKLNKIPTIELQHGTVGRYHINYNFRNNKNLKLKTFPDLFLSWGSYWTKNSRLPLNDKNLILTGFPYLNHYKKKYIQTQKGRSKKILFLSQLRMDIANFANFSAKLLPEYKVLFKTHPAESSFAEGKYLKIFNSKNVILINDEKKDLYSLFLECEIVCGVSSTALIEATEFCNKIAILKLPGWEYFEDLNPTNKVKFINNSQELVDFCNEAIDYSSENLNEYFQQNSEQNINNIIESLIKT